MSEFIGEPFLELLREKHEVEYDADLYGKREQLLDSVADARAILIRNRTRVDREFVDAARNLIVVGRLGVGLDNIDMKACAAAGILVKPAVGANAVSVAEYVLAAMLSIAAPGFGMTGSMTAGEWPRQGHAFGMEAFGKTLGLLGFGSIGRHVARRASAFDMEIIAHDPILYGDDPVWKQAETSVTRRAAAPSRRASAFTFLSPKTLAPDRNRGPRPHETDRPPDQHVARRNRRRNRSRCRRFAMGRIGGAALDVFSSEPLGPEPAAMFAGIGNLLLTPHLAGNTRESVDRVAEVTVANVLEVLAAAP